jgi:hypothetical protein
MATFSDLSYLRPRHSLVIAYSCRHLMGKVGYKFKGVGTFNERHGTVVSMTLTDVHSRASQSVPAQNITIKT